MLVFSLLRILGREFSRFWGLRAAEVSPFSGVSFFRDFLSIDLFICFLIVWVWKPRVQRPIVRKKDTIIIRDMDVTITLHGAHLPMGV